MDSEHNKSIIFNYCNIIFSCYFNNEVNCYKMIENHTLVYVYSGELMLEEMGKKTKIHGGECVFIRKDNRVNMTKQPRGEEQFKAVFMIFTRKYLRELFQTLDKNQIPMEAENASPA